LLWIIHPLIKLSFLQRHKLFDKDFSRTLDSIFGQNWRKELLPEGFGGVSVRTILVFATVFQHRLPLTEILFEENHSLNKEPYREESFWGV
jgi:hypothetical protein